MNSDRGYQYKLVYRQQKPVCGHEAWLIDWTLEWVDYGCARLVQVRREEYIDAIQFAIRIEVSNEPETDEIPEIHEERFERLERHTSDLIVSRGGTDVTEIIIFED
ncbi:hypothetical protein OB919_08415 [Halobacteria archaeon AArc-curdl1]|uniref:Uncharacterized protein n=1 Tax=Natronosalvus hydrolyticus TaxID=2979988 RepID=A0AAP3E6I3_9EURY|nr:hypothetical protein [Halobacteria archaeon AArc-curdl1]